MNSLFEKNIYLNEADHTYVLTEEPDLKFISVTTFIGYFFKPFDQKGIANKLTLTHPAYQGMIPQALVAQWEVAKNLGTKVHKEIEEYIKTGTLPKEEKALLAVELINNELPKDRFEIFPEVMVYSKELGLAGTIDLLIKDKATGAYSIWDWKTNKAIKSYAFNGEKGVAKTTSHLPDANYYHYALQLSFYKYLLEKHYNISVSDLSLIHLTNDGVDLYEMEYLYNEIEAMLKENLEELKEVYNQGITAEYWC